MKAAGATAKAHRVRHRAADALAGVDERVTETEAEQLSQVKLAALGFKVRRVHTARLVES
jgi:hypothetical protein